MCWPTWAATAATPTPVTSRARPTAAPSTRPRRAMAAADDTAGQVMVMPGGQIATTEYSASTGGYTSSANQESPFTAVPDDGDAVCIPDVACNTNHQWTTSVSDAAIRGRVAPDRHVHRTFRRAAMLPIPAIPSTPPSGGWTPSRRRAVRDHHDPRHRVLRRPRPQLGSLHRQLDQRRRSVSISGQGLGSRHRDGPVGCARLRHRPGQRRRELDVSPRS